MKRLIQLEEEATKKIWPVAGEIKLYPRTSHHPALPESTRQSVTTLASLLKLMPIIGAFPQLLFIEGFFPGRLFRELQTVDQDFVARRIN